MGDVGPAGDNPFEGLPIFGDLARMLQSQGPVSWDAARQFAQHVATGGTSEPNPDPSERIRLEEIARVADLRVSGVTGLSTSTTGGLLKVLPVTRGEWARRTLDAHRPMLERLGSSLSSGTAGVAGMADELDDDASNLLGGLFSMIGPMMLGMQAGAMVGHLATRALGQYDLPLPRPPSDELLVVAPNVADFASEWSLPPDDVRLWLCLSEITVHAVLGVPHVRERLSRLVDDYVGGFHADPTVLEDRLATIDPANPDSLQDVLGDPAALLGAIRSPAQGAMLPQLSALVAAITGYVDHVVEDIGSELISSYRMVTEALHRRRVEAGSGDRFIELLLGLELDRAQYERGTAFADGIVERAGIEGLAQLWESPRKLPTPAEVDAPGLWLARIELPDDDGDAAGTAAEG